LLRDDGAIGAARFRFGQGVLGLVQATELDERQRTAEERIRPIRTRGQHGVVLAQGRIRAFLHERERREADMILYSTGIGRQAGAVRPVRPRKIMQAEIDDTERVPGLRVSRVPTQRLLESGPSKVELAPACAT
jgi:hypothetical protein